MKTILAIAAAISTSALASATPGLPAPGFTLTEMTADIADTEVGRRRLADMPLGRFGRADEVADAVLFLLSDASSLFTGQTLNPNAGGYMP